MEIPRLGRRWAMVLSAALMGVSFFLYAPVSSFKAYTGTSHCTLALRVHCQLIAHLTPKASRFSSTGLSRCESAVYHETCRSCPY